MPLIAFASPKGGVGKTTLAANVADALCRSGRSVLLLDLDPQNALRLHFGVPLHDTSGFMADLPRRPDWRAQVRRTASGVLLLPHGAMELRAVLEQSLLLEREPALLAAPCARCWPTRSFWCWPTCRPAPPRFWRWSRRWPPSS
ncbi:cellulose synthase operon protein YhjQ/BcsQ [Teichococcus aestuarii]|uniref:cellulose synthase operon protein YhjQ/BcsQ n=1 Tax=Teichococcus aestuarii TaxID=568898 RepID=UPI00360EB1EE